MLTTNKKPRPRLLEQRAQKSAVATQDRAERRICRLRSKGTCEVRVLTHGFILRCWRNAFENHHLLGGMGRRNRGESILARNRLDVCRDCHQEITGHVLKLIGSRCNAANRAATAIYERVT